MHSYYIRLLHSASLLSRKFTIVFFVLFLSFLSHQVLAQATLTTDHDDYPPGSTVILTGSSFQPGEIVQLQVLHYDEDGDNSGSSAHQPWTINADESGNFITTWYIPSDEDELNATLRATADGQSSGLHAEAIFTDANWSIGPAYDLCGGVQTELTFTVTQTGTSASSSFQNGRFRIVFPAAGTIASASIVSVSASKNWTITLLAGNDVCLRASTSADVLANGQSITFKLLVTPPNSLGQTQINGVSAAFGANCPSAGTTADLPLKIIRVSSLSPVFTQCPSDISVNTDAGLCSAVVNYNAQVTGTDPIVNYAFSGATIGTGSGTGSGSTFGKGTTHVKLTASNSCASVNCEFDVTVTDNELPSITCPENITLSACQNTATWNLPVAIDNCPGVTIEQTGGPASGSTFDNGTTNTITYTATDASGNQQTCSFTVSRAAALTATCSNTNPQLYFGYSGDQTSTIKVVPGGGVAPYTVSVSMNRPLNCNVINSSGDEVWVGGAGTTSSSGTACPVSGGGIVPVSTATGVTTFYTLNVTLMQDADITATVTDANGCVTTCTTRIQAEDARCFAGNSGISKVTICHRTGSASNPCVTICVDESAVQAHLAHGDFPGKCNPDCVAPAAISSTTSSLLKEPVTLSDRLKVKVFPNPTTTAFRLLLESDSREEVRIIVTDIYGHKVFQTKGTIEQPYIFGQDFKSGMYIVQVLQGKRMQTLKVTKGKG